MKRSLVTVFTWLTPLFFLFCWCPPLFAAGPAVVQPGAEAQRFVTIDFNDVDINLFIKYISELTQKNFIVDREVKGKVTIISPTRVSEDDAYRIFESVLEVHGFAAIPSGSVIKIVPSVQARSKNIATMHGESATSTEDKLITQIVALKYAGAEEIKNLLTPLVSKNSILVAHPDSGMLMITDYYSNITRLLDIIKSVDVPSGGEELAVIPLQYASAESVFKAIGQLFTSPAAGQKRTRPETIKIIPFERTNAMIVLAPKTSMQRIRDLIARLDANVPREEGNLRVIFLQHANAEEMVKVLMNLPSDQAGSKEPGATGSAPVSKALSSGPAISKDIKLVADTATNSLIITGPREEYEVVADVIKKLDIPRRMVYLEALIMEVRVDKTFEIGVQWATGDGSVVTGFSGNSTTPFGNLDDLTGGVPSGTATTTTRTGVLPSGFSLGVLQKGIRIGDVVFPNLGAVLNAFKSDTDINVIATPQVLTTDNKKATIKVGENVPFQTSQSANSAVVGQVFNNFEYKDVATSLTITPQVNQSDVIRMEIGVEVIKVKGTSASITPTTLTRTANTTVVVHNEETVVIGGMIGQDTNAEDSKVPLLGDIPLLGWLFKSHSNTDQKTNLYIFITPHIVESPAELAEINLKKRDEMEAVHREPGGVADQFFHPPANPAHSAALTDIGFAKLQNNDLARAREYFNQALKIDPENGAALVNLGMVCEREGKKAEAEALYRKVLARAPAKEEKKGGQGQAAKDPWKDLARENLNRLKQSNAPGK